MRERQACQGAIQSCVVGALADEVAGLQSPSMFFGEHLLPMNRGKPVALVESEKTALIASWYLPEYVWLATGGKNGCLNADALRVLRGRQVILYPDLGATEQWGQKLPLMKSLGIEATIFNFMNDVADDTDKSAGYDIADYLLQIEPDQAVFAKYD